MRSLISALTFLMVFLVCAASAAPGGAKKNSPHPAESFFKGHTELNQFKKMHELFAKLSQSHRGKFGEAGRAMLEQQTELLAPVSDEPQCQTSDFTTTVFTVFAQCATVVDPSVLPLSQLYLSDAAATTAYDTYCATACVETMRTTLFQTNLEVCLHPLLRFLLTGTFYMCDTTSSSGEHCGVQNARFTRFASCGEFNSELCPAASDTCESFDGSAVTDADSSLPIVGSAVPITGACRPITTSAVVNSACSGGCLEGYIAALRTSIPDDTDTLPQLVLGQAAVCGVADDGEYCQAKLSSYSTAVLSGTTTAATIGAVCGDAATYKCLRIASGLTAAATNAGAKSFLTGCAASVQGSTSLINSQCIPFFRQIVGAGKESRISTSTLCIQNAADSYCSVERNQLYGNACYNAARFTAIQASCTSRLPNCAATTQTQIDNMGCCAGTIQEGLTAAYTVTAEDYPNIDGYTPVADSTAQLGTTAPLTLADNEQETTTSGFSHLADLAFCGVTGLNQTLRKRCALSTTTIDKELDVSIRWDAIFDDATLFARILATIRSDVAANLGLDISELINNELVENTAVSVTATASGRRMAVQNTGSGTKYTFTISAANEDVTEAAGSDFDSATAANSLVLTETVATVTSDCSSCTDTAASLTVTPVTTDSTSGASALGMMVSSMVAVTLALFL